MLVKQIRHLIKLFPELPARPAAAVENLADVFFRAIEAIADLFERISVDVKPAHEVGLAVVAGAAFSFHFLLLAAHILRTIHHYTFLATSKIFYW